MSIAYENIYIIETGPNTLDITSRYILKTLKKQIDEADEEKTKLRHESVNPENLQNSTRSGTRLKVPKMVKERITIQMHKHLEKATTDFMGLWQTVNEENSKINKISFAVKQAHKNISNSRSFWAKNFKYLSSLPRLQELYGRFLKDVLDQKDDGTRLIQEAMISLRRQSIEKVMLKNVGYLAEISGFSMPSFVLMKSASVRKTRKPEIIQF